MVKINGHIFILLQQETIVYNHGLQKLRIHYFPRIFQVLSLA
jgi:hypothetical protein